MLMDTISGIMTPVIPAIIGAAMIKVLLTLLPMIGVLNTSGDTYQLLTVIGDGAFFFMPVLIAVSASKKFGTNVYYAASIALIMLHPNFISMMTTAHDANETIRFLGLIPVTYATYSYSVIPIILAVWSLKYVEKFVDKITPVITKNFLKPMLVVLIEAPIALIILGPLGAICGNVLSDVVYFIHDKLGFIAVGLVAGIYPFVVMAGMHHAFTPIKLGMIATTGYENFICIGELCSNMAQGAASLAVAIKSKNKDFKQIAGSSAFSGTSCGNYRAGSLRSNIAIETANAWSMYRGCGRWFVWRILPTEMLWNCHTCDCNDCSICGRKPSDESFDCSAHNLDHSDSCIYCYYANRV